MKESNVIFLLGLSKSGKDTVGNYMVEHLGFTRVSFADQLKYEYAQKNNIDLKLLIEQGSEKEKHREGLINMAETVKLKDPLHWLRRALNPYLKEEARIYPWNDNGIYNFKEGVNLVITDCRRICEIDYVWTAKSIGTNVKLIHVDRPDNIDNDMLTHHCIGYTYGLHKALPGANIIDAIILNDSTKEALYEKTNRCLGELVFQAS